MSTSVPPVSAERVLPTLNADGTRRWLRPKLSRGRYYRRRLMVAWALIALFAVLPHVSIGGQPAMLLDIAHRRFALFGATFLPTDTMLLMLLLLGIFLVIFLLTAIFGRVWCGWACPQTVYMEFLFRPVERWLEGNRARQLKLDREGPDARRLLKYGLFVLFSMALAHTFLAYFVGVESLSRWITRSPFEHPAAFLVMAATTGLMLFDFGVLREQVCLVACPYGRFQSVLLDRRSLIVGYDEHRGEPRRRLAGRGAAVPAGDCVDCAACVITCPTGIDIRDGLQMECLHCTQCIDACDTVMAKVGKDPGLIRYTTRDEIAGAPRRFVRPRILIYPVLAVIVWGALAWALTHRRSADVTVLRGIGAPFTSLPGGTISNQIRVKIVNRERANRTYAIALAGAPDLELVSPDNPLAVPAGHSATASIFVLAPPEALASGVRDIRVRVEDDAGFAVEQPYRLVGPAAERPR